MAVGVGAVDEAEEAGGVPAEEEAAGGGAEEAGGVGIDVLQKPSSPCCSGLWHVPSTPESVTQGRPSLFPPPLHPASVLKQTA